MSTFIVKSTKLNEITNKPHFWVLCKGMNSGKPLSKPCPNSFCVIVDLAEEKEIIYWVSFTLWKSNAFHPFLRGSVIPFITINDYKHIVTEKLQIVKRYPNNFVEVINQLKLVELKEKQFLENLKLIQDVKRALVYRYFAKNS